MGVPTLTFNDSAMTYPEHAAAVSETAATPEDLVDASYKYGGRISAVTLEDLPSPPNHWSDRADVVVSVSSERMEPVFNLFNPLPYEKEKILVQKILDAIAK